MKKQGKSRHCGAIFGFFRVFLARLGISVYSGGGAEAPGGGQKGWMGSVGNF